MYQSTRHSILEHLNCQACRAMATVVNCRPFNTWLGSNQAGPRRSVADVVVMEWVFLQVLNFPLSVSFH